MLRKLIKYLLSPLRQSSIYEDIQAWSMSRDILSGRLSEPELDLLPYAVKSGETVLDIGANFGMYTYPLAQLVGKEGKVYAFEPIPFTYQTLEKVVKRLSIDSVVLRKEAVSTEKGELSFTIPIATSGQLMAGQAHFGTRDDDHSGKETQVRWNKTTTITCPTISLDEELQGIKNLSFIKIDIEGGEFFAFEGGKKTINHFLPTVLIEINPWFLDGFDLQLADLLDPFEKLEYEIFKYEENPNKLYRINHKSQIVEDNYLLIHPKFKERFIDLFA